MNTQYTNRSIHPCQALSVLLGPVLLGLPIAGCSVSIPIHRGVVVPANAPDSNPGSIVAVGTDARPSDDAWLTSRRDDALAVRQPETLVDAESWSPAPIPDIGSSRRINLWQRWDSYVYFNRTDHQCR
jgi:hypothetical protein